MPPIVWSRLFFDLAPYLTVRQSPGGHLLGFFHRQISQVATEEYLSGANGRARHADLVHLFAPHAADASFPSDHTTAAFAIAR